MYKVARVRKRIFINFDKNWRTDFTIGLTARSVRRLGLTAQQIDALKGRRVQVRGWIERRGGPFIFLRSRNQIRSLDPLRPPDKSDTGQNGQRPGPLAGWPLHVAPAPKQATGSRPPPDGDWQKRYRPAVVRPGGIDL